MYTQNCTCLLWLHCFAYDKRWHSNVWDSWKVPRKMWYFFFFTRCYVRRRVVRTSYFIDNLRNLDHYWQCMQYSEWKIYIDHADRTESAQRTIPYYINICDFFDLWQNLLFIYFIIPCCAIVRMMNRSISITKIEYRLWVSWVHFIRRFIYFT